MTAFKERSNTEQYYQDKGGNWIKTNENTINSLWLKWVNNNNGKSKPQYQDKDGFTVFEYYKEKDNEK